MCFKSFLCRKKKVSLHYERTLSGYTAKAMIRRGGMPKLSP